VPNDTQWRRLVEIHNHVKSIFLCAEEMEFNGEFRDFLQPVMELRHALEHIIRSKSAELGINQEPDAHNPNYITSSYDKAIGHEYRSFFDAADWLSVCIREHIIKALSGYSPQCLVAVMPTYYTTIRPRIDQICKEIAIIRGKKDIAKDKDLVDEVGRYRDILNELLRINEQVQNAIPALAEWKSKDNWSKFLKWGSGILASLIAGIVIGFVLHGCGLK